MEYLDLRCSEAARKLKARPEHYIILLEDFFSMKRRDQRGNLLRPTLATMLREQGFQVKIMYAKEGMLSHGDFRVLHIRTQEKLNYFKLLFHGKIKYYLKQVKDI